MTLNLNSPVCLHGLHRTGLPLPLSRSASEIWKIYSAFHYALNLLFFLESGLALGEIVDSASVPVNTAKYNSL